MNYGAVCKTASAVKKYQACLTYDVAYAQPLILKYTHDLPYWLNLTSEIKYCHMLMGTSLKSYLIISLTTSQMLEGRPWIQIVRGKSIMISVIDICHYISNDIFNELFNDISNVAKEAVDVDGDRDIYNDISKDIFDHIYNDIFNDIFYDIFNVARMSVITSLMTSLMTFLILPGRPWMWMVMGTSLKKSLYGTG